MKANHAVLLISVHPIRIRHFRETQRMSCELRLGSDFDKIDKSLEMISSDGVKLALIVEKPKKIMLYHKISSVKHSLQTQFVELFFQQLLAGNQRIALNT